MLPHINGEVARLHREELSRAAALRRQHPPSHRPARRAGTERSLPVRSAHGLRQAIGLSLIRLGMRFVDPVALLR
ncbi:hypothetical protein [Euzebya pacifica]|uniref:hypothetical protein n=1 Tax=Euzebya pacifica TaxID=1608957 RepID=UPI0030F79996